MQKSVTLTLSGNKTSLSADYFPSINVNKNFEIALLPLQTYNIFSNINEINNKKKKSLTSVLGFYKQQYFSILVFSILDSKLISYLIRFCQRVDK